MNRMLHLLVLGLLGLSLGCGGSAATPSGKVDGGTKGGGSPQQVAKDGLSPVKAVEDFIAGTYGPNYEIIGTPKEQPATFEQKPAVVVHVEWKMKGEASQKSELYLVQDGSVRRNQDYDTSKSLDANVAAFLQDRDRPKTATKGAKGTGKRPRPTKQ